MTYPFAITIPTFPKPEDFKFWLEAEVDNKCGQILQALIDQGQARWIPDPQIHTVWAIEYIGEHELEGSRILLVLYDNGEDFEMSTQWEELYAALGYVDGDPE